MSSTLENSSHLLLDLLGNSTSVANSNHTRGSDGNDSSDEEDDFHVDEITELADIRKRYTEGLNLSENYVRSWSCNEAFRESYQNW